MWWATLLFFATVSAANAAPSSPRDAAEVAALVERLDAEGAALYRAGDHRAAVERFERAYRLYPDPTLLFNAGRAYEAAGDVERALRKYEACASSPDVAAELTARATKKIAKLKEMKKAGPRPSSTGVDAARAVAPPPSDAPIGGAKIEDQTSPPSPALRIAGAALGGAGVLAMAAGGTFFGLGAQAHGDVEDAKRVAGTDGVAPLTRVEAARLVARGESDKVTGTILGAVGFAAGAVGATLLTVGFLEDDSP
jgi:tetratricopeptide (TPR) repeat protein